MNSDSTPDFKSLPFSEKKAMLDFAENQMEEFAQHVAAATVKDGDPDSTRNLQALQNKFELWSGIRNAIIVECEQYVQTALGEGFDPSQHLKKRRW